MIPSRTHEVQAPSPEHQSIFTNTYNGVPNPQIPHEHPYPTRFHGPVYGVPRFGLPYRKQTWQAPSGLPGLAPTGGCVGCSGFGLEITGTAAFASTPLASIDTSTTKGRLAQAVIEIIEKRGNVVLDQNTKAFLTLPITFYPKGDPAAQPAGTLAALSILAAYSFEQKKDYAAASKEWTKAREWLNVSINESGIQQQPSIKTAHKTVTTLLKKFAASPPRRLLQVARPSSSVLDLVSKAPVPTLAPPKTKMIEFEPDSMTPWLILGGVVVAGTAGYFYWKKSKKTS